MSTSPSTVLLTLLPLLIVAIKLIRSSPARTEKLAPTSERVLILGATSGIGRALAHEYAKRGAWVCIVGRRQNLVQEVVKECKDLGAGNALGLQGDFALVDDMVTVREALESGMHMFDNFFRAPIQCFANRN
jgi:NAD(P)-dependent dehydrogenase (short-subunit alcohol dehydrogenase family)